MADNYDKSRGVYSDFVFGVKIEDEPLLSEEQIEQEYKRYHIRKFNDEKEFRRFYTGSQEDFKKNWEIAQYRQKLIEHGLYGVALGKNYQKTFIKMLEDIAIEDEYINYFKNLDTKYFINRYLRNEQGKVPSAVKDDNMTGLLPDISQAYRYSGKNVEVADDDILEGIIEDIKEAVRQVDPEVYNEIENVEDNEYNYEDNRYDTKVSVLTVKELRNARGRKITGIGSRTFSKQVTNMLYFAPKDLVIMSDDSDDDIIFAIMDRRRRKGTLYSGKISKKTGRQWAYGISYELLDRYEMSRGIKK